MRSLAPVLTTHPVSGELECVRYNPFDRAPLRTVNPRDLPGFYRALAALSRKVEVSLTPKIRRHGVRVKSLHPRPGRSGGRLLSPLTWCLISILT